MAMSTTKLIRAKFERFIVAGDTGGLRYQLTAAAFLRKVLRKLAWGRGVRYARSE